MRTVKHRPETARHATNGRKAGKPTSPAPKRGKRAATRPRPLTWDLASVEMAPSGALVFVVPVLESANRLWRSQRGRTHKSTEAATDERQARARFRHVPQLDGDLEVWITWYRAAKQGDADNRIKPALDLLKGIAYHDDASVAVIHMARIDDPTQPARLVITIAPLTDYRAVA